MDKKMFLAMSLCAGIFLLWQQVYLKPYSDYQAKVRLEKAAEQANSATTPTAAANAAIGAAAAPAASVKGEQAQKITLGSDAFKIEINTQGGVIVAAQLPEVRGSKTQNLDALIGGGEQLLLSVPGGEIASLEKALYKVVSKNEATGELKLAYEDPAVQVDRVYKLDASRFTVDHEARVKFKQARPKFLFVGMQAVKQVPKELAENERRTILWSQNGKNKHWTTGDISEVADEIGEGTWTAATSRYFMKAVVDSGSAAKPQFQLRPSGDLVTANLVYKTEGDSVSAKNFFYYGPKDLTLLKQIGHKLDTAVDFGWFTFFAYPMFEALKWFYSFVHNYGIAIIMLTLLVKAITYPLTYKSMKGMKEMQRIQPQLARLREKHKDDKEKLNREMLQLMRANGYNPMSGCLPMIIQMPIFIALYNVFYGAFDLYGQPFFGWIHDLSAKDPLYVMPVLLALTMFLQQKLTPSQNMDPAQQRMMMLMPLIFGFMMLWLPAGLTLYMLVNSVASIAQQLWINRSLGLKSGSTQPVVVA